MKVEAITTGVVNMHYVEEGAIVEEDEKIATMESMKTMFDVYAPCAGRVHFLTSLGEVVNRGQAIAEVIPC